MSRTNMWHDVPLLKIRVLDVVPLQGRLEEFVQDLGVDVDCLQRHAQGGPDAIAHTRNHLAIRTPGQRSLNHRPAEGGVTPWESD